MMEESTFQGSGLPGIVLPSSVEVLGEWCFSGCPSLTSITFESGSKLQRIEESAFKGSGLLSIEIPSSVEVLGEGALSIVRV
jgi:dextranase